MLKGMDGEEQRVSHKPQPTAKGDSIELSETMTGNIPLQSANNP